MKTAVDWIIEEIEKQGWGYIKISIPKEIKHQAKEMQRQQHAQTWDAAIENLQARGENTVRAWEDFDDYFKSKYETTEKLE